MSSTAADDTGSPGELYCTTCEKHFAAGSRCPADGTRLVKLKARTDPFVGRELDGRYTVVEKLGQGGMGAVYRARQHSVDREVAIKVVNANLITDDEVIKRFLREAKLASKLAHPNAVAVLDFGQTDDGVFYLVMEMVSGRTLAQELKATGRFRPERVVRIGMQVLDALDGAHALSIVHRDLKPSNIMLLAQGRDLVKVLDFGLAKSILPDQTSTTMTGTGAVLGTPAFMPPELATGRPCDGRADLYSLGVILYVLGSGRLPFVSDSVHELIAMHGSDEPAPPMTGVPPRLARVIDRLLEKDPAKRYASAAAALQALEASHGTMTPVSGVQVESSTPGAHGTDAALLDTALHETPLPPSLLAGRASEVEDIGRSSTLLATEAKAAVAVSVAAGAPRRSRSWIAITALAVVAAAIGAAVVLGGGDEVATNRPASPAPVVDTAVPPPKPSELAPSIAPPAEASSNDVHEATVHEATVHEATVHEVTIEKPSADPKSGTRRKATKPAAKPPSASKPPATPPPAAGNPGSAATPAPTPF